MTTDRCMLQLKRLPEGRSRQQAELAFELLDAAAEREPFVVAVELEVECFGAQLRLRGRITGSARAHCHRCLEEFARPVETDMEVLIYKGKDPGLGDEVVVVPDEQNDYDLGPHIREALIVDEPIRALCKPDCQGLCSQCGTNRNVSICQCAQALDPRWSALGELAKRIEPN